ncbi:MAG: hypothetical protein RLZZ413_764, partial [Pseudomonadota bacterium]
MPRPAKGGVGRMCYGNLDPKTV